jgi:NADPH2:quinone reductase
VQIERFAAPEVLEMAEVSSPEPKGDEILIEVEAVGVNRADLLTRSGLYHRAGQPPLVPGFEGSDVVREVGDSVECFATGDRVFALGGRPGFYAELAARASPGGTRCRHRLRVGQRRLRQCRCPSRLGSIPMAS